MKTVMKGYVFAAALTIVSLSAQSQYYYSDILGTKNTNQQYQTLKASPYRQITGINYDGSEPSKDFLLEQTMSSDGNSITIRSASLGSSESYFTSYYDNGRIVRSIDSGNNAINNVLYTYDASGNVTGIKSNSKDFDGAFINEENHIWSYNSSSQPEKMLKVRNKVDTMVVTFVYDEQGNIAEEHWRKGNSNIETYYYYYNSSNQLTDVVRYNKKAKTMLPDYLFEYDNKGMITSMTQAQMGSANYIVWRYAYTPEGLKQRDVAFNKQKELVGRVEYSYK